MTDTWGSYQPSQGLAKAEEDSANWNDPSDGAMNSGAGFSDGQEMAAGSHWENNGEEDSANTGDPADDKCFGCGEVGHRRAECPNPRDASCRYCKQEGHMVKDCPDKPPMVCENCGEEGHMRKNCENARKINRDHIASVTPDQAWDKLKLAVSERDADDAKEAVQEYVKALDGNITYRALQEALIDQNIGLWLIAIERPLISIFTNMDLQGNLGKKYSVSFRFSEKADRPRELEGWPKDRTEILSRLDDAGEVVDKGIPLCSNCKELGHISKFCTQEKMERSDAPKICCNNCGQDGHRIRDCPEPRVDKFACKNCGKSGHKVADCEEPPNPENVECRKCNEMGHFAKDCPQGGGSRACRNCGQEGHMAKECDQPRNMDTVTCRNCEKTGHFSRDCPEPKDWSKVQCSNCEKFGHTKVRCKEPPVEEIPQDDGFDAGDSFAQASGDGGWNGGSGGNDATEEVSQYNNDNGGW